MPISFPVHIQTAKVSSGENRNVFYPQVTKMENQSLEQLINRSIVKQTQQLIQIKQRDIFLLNGFTVIRPDQDFYIADKALVIYFQLYEITPYAYGFPMFPISVYEIQDIIDENGPLGRML
ncbi:MAG TPA: DUF3298 domain-containing protein [Bacilli bacterium]|nr:DUF3298 domain-containing protein [Bacilli bacterium]